LSSLNILGLELPLSCKGSEPVALKLADTLGLEELLAEEWQFSGTTILPTFKCEGGLGAVGGLVLSTLLSGPENQYSLRFAAPAP
jgi:hypothetical protein